MKIPIKVNSKQSIPINGCEVLSFKNAYLKGKIKTSKIIPNAINLFLMILKILMV